MEAAEGQNFHRRTGRRTSSYNDSSNILGVQLSIVVVPGVTGVSKGTYANACCTVILRSI